MQNCAKCGAPLDGGAFCTKCGAPISSAAAPTFFTAASSLDGSTAAPKATPASAVTPPPAPASAPRPEAARPSAPASAPRPAPAPAPRPAVTPPPAAAPAGKKAHRRISVGKELRLLLRQGFLVLVGDKKNLIISLLFPILAAAVTVWIAGENMFMTNEGTKSACFVLVCAAIWGGLFNSIQTIVKERSNIKRDYVSGALRIECYVGSRAIIQLFLCLFQSFILALSVPLAALVWPDVSEYIPSEGLFGLPIMLEFFFSLFLIMLSSDAMGILISCLVKKEEVASKLAPYILIAQLLFSGFLFYIEEGSPAMILSYLMVSRWGIGALGSICNLNELPRVDYLNCLNENPESAVCGCGALETIHFPRQDDLYDATPEHLITVLFIMLVFVIVSLVAADLLLHRVKKDGRD